MEDIISWWILFTMIWQYYPWVQMKLLLGVIYEKIRFLFEQLCLLWDTNKWPNCLLHLRQFSIKTLTKMLHLGDTCLNGIFPWRKCLVKDLMNYYSEENIFNLILIWVLCINVTKEQFLQWIVSLRHLLPNKECLFVSWGRSVFKEVCK